MIAMLCDISFYSYTYGEAAKIPEEQFALWEKRAEAELLVLTSGRLLKTEITDNIKLCICEICEAMYINEGRRGIAAENNDGYSVTYDKEVATAGREILEIAKRYLSDTDLLYRGVCL